VDARGDRIFETLRLVRSVLLRPLMRRLAVACALLSLSACGEPRPETSVSAYLHSVDVELYSDGAEAFVYLRPIDDSGPCPDFGARVTLDGRELKQFQFGGEVEGGSLGGPSHSYCATGSYRVGAKRAPGPTTSSVRIWDETGEIRFSVADVLTEPTLVWDSASELRPSEYTELSVTPSSLTFEDNLYVYISGLDPDPAREFGAGAYENGSRLSFSVPDETPPGAGQIRLRYDWQPQLSAPVLDCAGAASCKGSLRFSETMRLPITVLPP
jgi:hypothetical protein